MSSEKQPTPTPEQGTQETLDSEGTKNEKEDANGAKASENTTSVLSAENKSFFGRMSERGAKIANQAYEGLYKIPGVRRVVGKLEIAYKQFWIDRHQEKAVQFKEKVNSIDSRVHLFSQSKKDIESAIENLKSENIPGVESLQIKLQKIDREKAGLMNEKDKVQSKFEARYNKLKLYTNERDRVADKLIEGYGEKLKPMEVELEKMSTFKDETDLQIAVTEAKYKNKLTKIEGNKAQIEKALRKTGMSEKEIIKFEGIKYLDKMLADGREKMRIEKENLTQRKAEINKKIAKVDAKANSCRDKREEFIRVKEGRPIKIDVAAREKGEEFKGGEETQAHPRRESEEESAEDKEQLQTADFISGWNTFLKENYKDDAEFIDAKDFLKETRLLGNEKINFKDFKNILGKYLKYRKLPVDQFNQGIDKFFEQKVEGGK